MGAHDFESLREHVGHKMSCVAYGHEDTEHNVAIECKDCNEVLLDFDKEPEDTDQTDADKFFTWMQELYETAGNASQLDEDFVNLVYHKLKNHLPDLNEVI